MGESPEAFVGKVPVSVGVFEGDELLFSLSRPSCSNGFGGLFGEVPPFVKVLVMGFYACEFFAGFGVVSPLGAFALVDVEEFGGVGSWFSSVASIAVEGVGEFSAI